ncbi:hypothetical protein [Hymenobacter terrenus]|uniref:hypothetical protein n=1 Tax=Hymenobacter terrenus TaxID=1629124 RepID=UPI0006195086|nr:hypothetical protein [Hymenobacter terrenus]
MTEEVTAALGPIKATILAYMRQSGRAASKEISVPDLDRYLVYVKQEETYIGGNLLAVLQEMIEEGLIKKGPGSNIVLAEQEA